MAASANLSFIASRAHGSEGRDNVLWIQCFISSKTRLLYALPWGVLSLMRQTWRVYSPGQLKTDTPRRVFISPLKMSVVLCFERKKHRHSSYHFIYLSDMGSYREQFFPFFGSLCRPEVVHNEDFPVLGTVSSLVVVPPVSHGEEEFLILQSGFVHHHDNVVG